MRDRETEVIRFPHSRVTPAKSEIMRDLGFTPMSQKAADPNRGAMGHWCSRCQGVWYTYFLEVECPKCGNRQG